MINLIRADWYQFKNKKSSFWGSLCYILLPVAFVVLIRAVINYNSVMVIDEKIPEGANVLEVLGNNHTFQAEMIDLAQGISAMFLFISSAFVTTQVFNQEIANRTFINTFSFGYNRRSVVLSKFILSSVITIVLASLSDVAYSLSASLLLGSNFKEALLDTLPRTIKIFPSFMAEIAFFLMFGSSHKYFWNAYIIFVIMDELLPKVADIYPIVGRIFPYLPNSVIGTITLYNSVSYPVYLLVTFSYIIVMLIISEWYLEKIEIE